MWKLEAAEKVPIHSNLPVQRDKKILIHRRQRQSDSTRQNKHGIARLLLKILFVTTSDSLKLSDSIKLLGQVIFSLHLFI